MHHTARPHAAETADHHAFLLGIAVLAVALKFVASALLPFAGETWAGILDTAELVLALGAAALVVWIMLFKLIRLSPADRRAYFSEDSFVFEAMRQSRIASWNLTFLVLVVLEVLADRIGDVPATFFLQLTLAIMLGGFGLKFLYVRRDAGEDADA